MTGARGASRVEAHVDEIGAPVVRIHVALSNGLEFAAELFANPVAADLASRFPLTAVFSDFNGVEKVSTLKTPLRVRGVPHESAPEPGEIGYYAPSKGLVFYYGSVGSWPGLVRVGAFDLDPDVLADLPDGFTARLARADDVV